jgi:hypothetical protein
MRTQSVHLEGLYLSSSQKEQHFCGFLHNMHVEAEAFRIPASAGFPKRKAASSRDMVHQDPELPHCNQQISKLTTMEYLAPMQILDPLLHCCSSIDRVQHARALSASTNSVRKHDHSQWILRTMSPYPISLVDRSLVDSGHQHQLENECIRSKRIRKVLLKSNLKVLRHDAECPRSSEQCDRKPDT